MYYLSLCAIFRQENPWIEEWINYHQILGVEHFFLYNNDLDPTESEKILRPYVERGLVDTIPAPGESAQIGAYQDAIRHFGKKTYWMGFMDLDEFILPKYTHDVRHFLCEYESYSGMVINWNIFGSSGYERRPSNQINHFLRRAEDQFFINKHVKSIVKPSEVNYEEIDCPHIFPYHQGIAVNEVHHENRKVITEYTAFRIRINHYCVRSRQDFEEVKSKRGLATPSIERDDWFWESHDRNDLFDNEISHRFGMYFEPNTTSPQT